MSKEAQHFDKLDTILIGNSAGEGMVMHEPAEYITEIKHSQFDPIAAINNAETEGFPHGHIVIVDLSEKS